MFNTQSQSMESEAAEIESWIKKFIAPWATYLIRDALSGDVAAAIQLSNIFPSSRKGQLVVKFLFARAPIEVFRCLLRHTWQNDHHGMIAALENRLDNLKEVFRYACFEVVKPNSTSILYRGTLVSSDGSPDIGYSWTTDMEVARTFAWRRACDARASCVLEIQLTTMEVEAYFLDNDMGESEVVLLEDPDFVFAAAKKIVEYPPDSACTRDNDSDEFSRLMFNQPTQPLPL